MRLAPVLKRRTRSWLLDAHRRRPPPLHTIAAVHAHPISFVQWLIADGSFESKTVSRFALATHREALAGQALSFPATRKIQTFCNVFCGTHNHCAKL